MTDYESIKKILKSEFIGIDKQIDEIVDIIRPWYNNPELYDTPYVVNLWGMTGCGKTSLISRIIELLDECHNKMYINCHSMINQDLYFMEDFVDDNTTNDRSNKFIIFDDFQYIRTIKENGEEDSSSALSMMWNLMDTGILHEGISAGHFKIIERIADYLNSITSEDFIVDGKMTAKFLNLIPKNIRKDDAMCPFNITTSKSTDLEKTFFLNVNSISTVTYIGRMLNMEYMESNYRFLDHYGKLNGIEWKNFFNNLLHLMRRGVIKDYHNSMIFVVGNIDESYYGAAKQVNPEMNADQIYEITSRVNIVDIKHGLQRRFRNEQIARLGNTHIIYPSLKTKDFENIIKLYTQKYANTFFKSSGIKLILNDELLKCIYNEGVFPSQGVRPLFSTINDLIKTNIPKIIDKLIDHKHELKTLICGFDQGSKEIVAVAKDENENILDTVRISVYLRVRDSYKDNKESQVNTSVHESGHFILYKYLTGNAPVKVLSRSLETSCLGYMMEKFDEGVSSKKRLLDEITVCLGGYVAELLVFGDEYRSSGASSDIENATSIASSMVKQYGLNSKNEPILFSQANTDDNENTLILNNEDLKKVNDEIHNILKNCFEKAVDLLENNVVLHQCFKESSKKLIEKGELDPNDIKEISSKIETAAQYQPISDHYYADSFEYYCDPNNYYDIIRRREAYKL